MKTFFSILPFVFSLHIFAAEPSSPPKDSPERKAILDALLPPLNKAEGAKVKFVDDGTILVLNGWATVANSSFVREDGKEFSSGGGMFEPDYLGLVQRVGTEWRIRYWGFSGDIATQVEARLANPEAPAQLFLGADAILAHDKAADPKDEPSSPPKDSPERKAILDALLPPLNKAEGAKVKFVDDGTILVLNGWATVANSSFVREDGKEFSSGGGMFEPDYLGLVQRVGTEWRIRYWGFSGDIATQVEARLANPEAPAQLFLGGF